MKITYQAASLEHSVNSILLFQQDDTAPYWSDALFYFYPQLEKERLLSVP